MRVIVSMVNVFVWLLNKVPMKSCTVSATLVTKVTDANMWWFRDVVTKLWQQIVHNKSGHLTWLCFRVFWLYLVAWLYSAFPGNVLCSIERQFILVRHLDIEYFTSPFLHSDHGWKSWLHLLPIPEWNDQRCSSFLLASMLWPPVTPGASCLAQYKNLNIFSLE